MEWKYLFFKFLHIATFFKIRTLTIVFFKKKRDVFSQFKNICIKLNVIPT